MAVLQHIKHGDTPDGALSDWDSFLTTLSWPKGISRRDRRRCYRYGKQDAQKGLVTRNEYGEISSPYCEELVQNANEKIVYEWSQCNKRSLKAQSRIEQIQRQVAELKRQLNTATAKKDEELELVRRRVHAGDKQASNHLLQRRQIYREKPIIDAFEERRESLNKQITEAELEEIRYRHEIQECAEGALSREMYVRTDYLWHLAVYAYGAAERVELTPDMINDAALTNEPREQHERIFGALQDLPEQNRPEQNRMAEPQFPVIRSEG